MNSIQIITSKKKEVKIRDENGMAQIVVVQVWNTTVANLTLMVIEKARRHLNSCINLICYFSL